MSHREAFLIALKRRVPREFWPSLVVTAPKDRPGYEVRILGTVFFPAPTASVMVDDDQLAAERVE